ncbi:MAG TPA: glycosyltransferase family 39 protein [Beijerinckiaceae bacterium]
MEQALDGPVLRVRPLGFNAALTLAGLIAALLVPSVIWIFKEEIVWPWDQAWYAEIALHLAHAAKDGPLAWAKAMLYAVTSKPPLLQWTGQIAVPFAALLGSYERAFLLVNVAFNAATLAVVFSTVRRLGGSPLAAIAAVLLCGGASLFIGMSHQFFVEPAQALTVAGLMRLSLETGRLPAIRLAAATAIWMALAFLAKTTSVGFTVPLLAYIAVARFAAARVPKSATTRGDLALAGLAVLLVAATAAWYGVNWPSVAAHIRNATMTEVALHYGSIGTLGEKLGFWGSALLHALTPWSLLGCAVALVVLTALGGAALRTLRLPARTWLAEAVASGTLFAFCLAGTVAAGILAYASQINEETRFLAPMIPLVAVLAGWSLSSLRREWLTAAAAVLFAANAVAGHLHAHGVIALPPAQTSVWLKPYRVEPDSVRRFERAVRLSCDPKSTHRHGVVGVERPDFNLNSAAFFSEKQKGALGYRCQYTSLGYAETDVERALKRIDIMDSDYFVTLPADRIPADPKDVLNQVAKPVAERIAANPGWERITDPSEPAQVFRRRR